jgi:hypothetical protein
MRHAHTMNSRPVIHEQENWRIQMIEHRRMLFERVIQVFPHVMDMNPTKVLEWRITLSK